MLFRLRMRLRSSSPFSLFSFNGGLGLEVSSLMFRAAMQPLEITRPPMRRTIKVQTIEFSFRFGFRFVWVVAAASHSILQAARFD